MTTIAIILAAAAAGFGLAVWRRIPPPPLLLLIGVALNATGTLDPGPNMQNTLLLALTFLVFVVGAELDVSRVRDQKKAAIGVGLAQFFILGWFGLAAAKLLGF